jgi:predicted amidohydrolase YtcJ
LLNFQAFAGRGVGPALLDDDRLETIKEGRVADLTVLSDDLLKLSDDKLCKVSSVSTLQVGKIVVWAVS